MVGEIRDNETAQLVIHAGLTGHLVFSTLHTNGAWGSVPRLIDMGVEPFLLASTFNLVLAQRLVRKICPKCKAEEKVPDRLRGFIEERFAGMPQLYLDKLGKSQPKFYKGKGCEHCGESGYSGRSVVAEVIEIDEELRALVGDKFSPKEVRKILVKQDYVSLIQDGLLKAAEGVTTLEEILRVSKN